MPATLLSPRALLERQAEAGTRGTAAISFPGGFLGKSELPSGKMAVALPTF